MAIVAVTVPPGAVTVDENLSGDGYQAGYFFNGGTSPITAGTFCCGGMSYGTSISRFLSVPSRYFGWQVNCVQPGECQPPLQHLLDVSNIKLVAIDNTPPSVTALGYNNIWYESSRWVRGVWPASFSASDDSGVCEMQEVINGHAILGSFDWLRNQGSWTQCFAPPQTMNETIDTTQYANGPLSLQLWASDAATPSNINAPTETLHVDNEPVSVHLSGPSDAASNGGTQYVTARATAGPSGVSIACSIDHAAYQWHTGSSVQIPIQGLGAHTVSCYAQNGAVDQYGHAAVSPTASFSMSIRQPTVSGIWFPKLANAPRCSYVRVKVRVAGKWVTVYRHHRPVWVRQRAHTIVRKARRCHLRVIRQKVVHWKTVRRHGTTVRVPQVSYVRVVVPPQLVNVSSMWIPFGAGTIVAGWLGTSGLTPLGSQRVEVLGAAANGQGQFAPLATATTGANGYWAAPLPPGPSRVIEAVYGGTSTAEPSVSGQTSITVPAKLTLRIRPHHTHWGGKIRISGRVFGGWVPPSGEVVVLKIGWKGGSTEIGHLYTDASGRFSSTYTFLRGNGTEQYSIWAATAKETDYPFAPARCRRVAVTVSQR